MFSLILVTTFTPFLWGDSNNSSVEVSGFKSITSCIEASKEFVNYKTNEGSFTFYTKCVDKGETK